MSEWKNIWRESIEASRRTIIEDPKCKNFFKELCKKYPKDKMVLFEKAISLDWLKNYSDAIELYEKVSSENDGLPVEHWRDIASFLLERCKEKKEKRPLPNELKEFLAIGFNGNRDLIYCYQWNAFYLLHNFTKLPAHVRYLAISSITRIDSEPEMSVIIFRSCMEESFKKLHPERKDTISWLDEFVKSSILPKEYIGLSNMLRKNGNKAIHHGEIENSIDDIIFSFVTMMKYCNEEFSKR